MNKKENIFEIWDSNKLRSFARATYSDYACHVGFDQLSFFLRWYIEIYGG